MIKPQDSNLFITTRPWVPSLWQARLPNKFAESPNHSSGKSKYFAERPNHPVAKQITAEKSNLILQRTDLLDILDNVAAFQLLDTLRKYVVSVLCFEECIIVVLCQFADAFHVLCTKSLELCLVLLDQVLERHTWSDI